jgi:hypothetical protein
LLMSSIGVCTILLWTRMVLSWGQRHRGRCALGAVIAAAYQLTRDFDTAHKLGHEALGPIASPVTLMHVNDTRGHLLCSRCSTDLLRQAERDDEFDWSGNHLQTSLLIVAITKRHRTKEVFLGRADPPVQTTTSKGGKK